MSNRNRPYLYCGMICSNGTVTTCRTCLRRAGRVRRLSTQCQHISESDSVDSLPIVSLDDNDVSETMSIYRTRHTKYRPPQVGDIGKKAVAAGAQRAAHKSYIDKTEKKRSHHQKSKGKDEDDRKIMRDFKMHNGDYA